MKTWMGMGWDGGSRSIKWMRSNQITHTGILRKYCGFGPDYCNKVNIAIKQVT